MLNSRPLVPLSSDLDDLNVLTPSHFLIGRSITSIVEPDLTNLNENSVKCSRSHGLRAGSPCCCKRRRYVPADTCCLANDPNSSLKAHDVAARSIKAMRGPSESVQEFAARINKLGTQIFQSGNSAQNTAVRNANDQLLQSRFISGLKNEIRRFVLSRDPLNLEESINAALIEEQNMKLNQIASEERSGLSSAQTENPVLSALADRLQEINLGSAVYKRQVQLQLVNQVGTILTEERTFSSASIVVFKGHRQAECRKRQRDERAARYQPPGEMPQASILLQVAPGQEGGMYISGNLLSATITQPPGIR
ncbi:hypothetical protein TNCV_2525481 [Trichonephila clavipes]|nr:hypothetical protein TNCV_2525481 [Trichonephila clavipes]